MDAAYGGTSLSEQAINSDPLYRSRRWMSWPLRMRFAGSIKLWNGARWRFNVLQHSKHAGYLMLGPTPEKPVYFDSFHRLHRWLPVAHARRRFPRSASYLHRRGR